jgi:hypothetical protein
MPQELEHLKEGMHTFEMLELLGQRVILCDFCRFDICSHGKDYWGTKRRIRMADVNHVKIIEPQLIKTLVCPQCHQRVDWLEAVEAIRNTGKHTTKGTFDD